MAYSGSDDSPAGHLDAEQEPLVFLYKLREGAASQSYGLQVRSQLSQGHTLLLDLRLLVGRPPAELDICPILNVTNSKVE